MLHADAWVRRLSAAPDTAERLAAAIHSLWADAQEVFAPLAEEEVLVTTGMLPSPMRALHAEWRDRVAPALEPIAGTLPDAIPSIDGRTRRTDDFRWLHAEFTQVARSDPGATW